MSAHTTETDEDIPLEERERRTEAIHFTRDRDKDTTDAVMGEARMGGEHIPGMVKESTVWDVYNNEARKVDNELVKDWTASLNFLLVFAAIFAAVLTAFIIESKKMLEPDQTEILVDIAMQYINSIGNQQSNNITRPDFEPTFEAISINCLLFASLGASLIAALASVVALQWVADYDAAITRGGSSPLDRAKRRQFRFAGVTRWKMGELIAALPLLLYSSVVLFWAGAIQWMWTLHHTVGYVVAGGTAMAVLFYGSTTILAAVYVSAPFRTPLSRGLYWAMGPSVSTTYRLFSRIPFRMILRQAAAPLRPVRFPSLFRGSAIFQRIRKHLLPARTSRYREDKAAEQDPSAASDALAWLAQQLPLSADSHERLLLCVSGILGLSTDNPPSPRFYEAPWLTILDFLSKHFMSQIFDQTSSTQDHQGVGIVLQCIDSPFIRSMIVPGTNYIRNPTYGSYWGQCCLVKDGNLNLRGTRGTTMTFLLSRDVPVPSLGSKYELEATWKLIRWRNSLPVLLFTTELPHHTTWSEVFSDIGRYSPEFLSSCLSHFRTWTNAPEHPTFRMFDYAVVFNSVVEQALYRNLTLGEALELIRAFSGYQARSIRGFGEPVDETNIIPQPLSYALAVGSSSDLIRATHRAITLVVVRVARLSVKSDLQQWAKCITLMLWINIPKDPGYWDALMERCIGDNEGTPKLWNEIEMSTTGLTIQGPHVEEITRLLWQAGNGLMNSLSVDAFRNPQSLGCLALLIQWVPHCYTHRTGSQHILLHLYECAERSARKLLYGSFHVAPVGLESIEWTEESLNPILAMLALSNNQGVRCLWLDSLIDLDCAGRILEVVKAVKRRPAEFLCLLADIVNTIARGPPHRKLVLILESAKQAIVFVDDESITPLLRPMASGVRRIQLAAGDTPSWQRDPILFKRVTREAQQICTIFQAKYAVRFISSSTQLAMLSCARSAAVAEPAMSWLRMHEAS